MRDIFEAEEMEDTSKGTNCNCDLYIAKKLGWGLEGVGKLSPEEKAFVLSVINRYDGVTRSVAADRCSKPKKKQ